MNNYMNIPYPNPYYINSNLNQDIKNIESRIYNLEKEIDILKNKINTLMQNKENNKINNYYEPQSYNMM